MSRTNLVAFPLDITLQILHHCTVNDIWHFACTSSHAQAIAHEALHHRFCEVVAPFTGAVNFGAMLRESESVVSGLGALQFAEGQTVRRPYILDVYTPFSTFDIVVRYLVDVEGYEDNSHTAEEEMGTQDAIANADADEIGDTVDEDHDNDEGKTGVYQVASLKRGERQINVTRSNTDAALYPISFLDCTMAMNYLNDGQFGCGYPAYTFRRQCLQYGRASDRRMKWMTEHEHSQYEVMKARYVIV